VPPAAVIGARSPAEITKDAGYLAAAVPDRLYKELARDGLIPALGPQ